MKRIVGTLLLGVTLATTQNDRRVIGPFELDPSDGTVEPLPPAG